MLRVEGLSVAYGDFQVLWDVSLAVGAGEIVALLGPNGAGKSTLLNSVSGLVPAGAGRIEVDGRRVDGLPAHARVAFGLAHVLERRRLFPHLTVRQNLLLGAYHPAAKPHRAESLAWVEGALPPPPRAPGSAGPHALRGRAADGGHRARPHGAAPPPAGRRADARARAAGRRRHPRRAPPHQPGAGGHGASSSSRTSSSPCRSPTAGTSSSRGASCSTAPPTRCEPPARCAASSSGR